MIFVVIARFIHVVAEIITLLVIINAVLSYFMSPYHPVRQFLNRIVEPLLTPIRRYVPPMGMFDFSPLVLIILVQIIDMLLTRILLSL